MKSFLLICFLSTSLSAADCTNCTTELTPFSEVVKNVEALEATTVVNCEDTLKEKAKKEYQENFDKLPKAKETIKGLSLEGSALELKYLKKMLGEKPNDDWKLAKECKNVLCALTKIYNSEESAERVLNIAKNDGYIVSLQKDFNNEKGHPVGQLFTAAEIRDIDLSYKILPPSYKKLNSMERLKRLPTGYISPSGPNVAAYASPSFHSTYFNKEGEITFLDGAFNNDKSWGPLVAVHELSHHVDFSTNADRNLGISEGAEYLKMSGWKKKKVYGTDTKTGKKVLIEDWEHAKDKKFITDYASTQPAEDFAETCAYYIFHPDQLKAIDPVKYEFIKKRVFKGKEYLKEIELQNPSKELILSCLNTQKEFKLYGSNNYFSTKLSQNCLHPFLNDLKITDPDLCTYNLQEIKNYTNESMASKVDYLSDFIKKCDLELPKLFDSCIAENNYQSDCPVKKYFETNNLTAAKLNLSEDDTKIIQENLTGKIHFANFKSSYNEEINSIVKKQGKNNFISDVLINGLSDKDKVMDNYPLNRQKYFLDFAIDGLAQKLESEHYKFDSQKGLKDKAQSFLMVDKTMDGALGSFDENVLKKATKSKDKNLELIKTWATSQGLDSTPKFEELAEALRKFGPFWR